MEVVIAIQLGKNHTSNACKITRDQQKECILDFNVPFDTQPNGTKSQTTPTVALFDDKGNIQSYGFEAELQHMQLDNASNHLLFRKFTLGLFCSNETVPDNLIAVNGKQMKSIDVVTAVLGHMIRHIKTKSGLQSLSYETKYVLTLPTCSCEDSMTFMKEAALKKILKCINLNTCTVIQAGCSSENIQIVEEAAAVLQFCLHNKQDGGETSLDDRCNRKFLIVECEEDNATMSVIHLSNENTMKIVFKNNTAIWSGDHVLHEFVEMISLRAKKALVDFFEKYPLEYYDFLQEVKSKIKRISPNCLNINIKISAVMMEEIRCSEGLQEAVLRTGLKFKSDKFVIKTDRFQTLFSEAGKRIVDYTEKELLTKFSDIYQIILVGEFAQSPMLQTITETSFSAENIMIPCEANMAAVRGAVFFGQGHVSGVPNMVPNVQDTPINNAQVALPKALSKEKGLRKTTIEEFFGEGHLSGVPNMPPNVQDTPNNNAQVALPKALSKERRLRKTTIEEKKPNLSESRKIAQQPTLPKVVSKERELRISTIEGNEPSPSEVREIAQQAVFLKLLSEERGESESKEIKEISQQTLCVIL